MLKQKYLATLSLGIYATHSPEKLSKLHQDLLAFRSSGLEKLTSSELFDIYELSFHVALLTNHDVEAKSMLDRLNDEFGGKKSQKMMILRLMYLEATGDEKGAVDVLGTNPDELQASRRLATFSRSKTDGSENTEQYIKALNYFLNLQPADVKTWCELADQYAKIGHFDKAVFCLKEVLLLEPLAYNIFYKAGLYLYYEWLQGKEETNQQKQLAQFALLQHARDLFLRSVEISKNYTKGWLGVAKVTEPQLLSKLEASKALAKNPKVKTYISEGQKLHQLATEKSQADAKAKKA